MSFSQITQLSEAVKSKELEIHSMEERYKKYIEKAKSVIKTLDPKVASAGGPGNGPANPELSALRSQLSEKDRLIETLEHVILQS